MHLERLVHSETRGRQLERRQQLVVGHLQDCRLEVVEQWQLFQAVELLGSYYLGVQGE